VDETRLVEVTRLHYDCIRQIARDFRRAYRGTFPIHESEFDAADNLAAIVEKGFVIELKRELYTSGKTDFSAPGRLITEIDPEADSFRPEVRS